MFQDVQEHQENPIARSHQQGNKNGLQESVQETQIQTQKEKEKEEERRQKEKEMIYKLQEEDHKISHLCMLVFMCYYLVRFFLNNLNKWSNDPEISTTLNILVKELNELNRSQLIISPVKVLIHHELIS